MSLESQYEPEISHYYAMVSDFFAENPDAFWIAKNRCPSFLDTGINSDVYGPFRDIWGREVAIKYYRGHIYDHLKRYHEFINELYVWFIENPTFVSFGDGLIIRRVIVAPTLDFLNVSDPQRPDSQNPVAICSFIKGRNLKDIKSDVSLASMKTVGEYPYTDLNNAILYLNETIAKIFGVKGINIIPLNTKIDPEGNFVITDPCADTAAFRRCAKLSL